MKSLSKLSKNSQRKGMVGLYLSGCFPVRRTDRLTSVDYLQGRTSSDFSLLETFIRYRAADLKRMAS